MKKFTKEYQSILDRHGELERQLAKCEGPEYWRIVGKLVVLENQAEKLQDTDRMYRDETF